MVSSSTGSCWRCLEKKKKPLSLQYPSLFPLHCGVGLLFLRSLQKQSLSQAWAIGVGQTALLEFMIYLGKADRSLQPLKYTGTHDKLTSEK